MKHHRPPSAASRQKTTAAADRAPRPAGKAPPESAFQRRVDDSPRQVSQRHRLDAVTAGPRTAAQASLEAQPGRPVAQLARYIKSIQNPANMDGEITRLTGASPLDTNTFGPNNEYGQALEINKWLAGGAGISTTHYNPGQNQYYSPVGFVVDVPDEQVLGHFEGDGSTSLLHEGRQQYWQAFEAIRAAMLDGGVIQGAIDGQGYGGDFAAPVTDLPTAKTLKGRIEAFLGNGAVSADAKAAARTAIKRCATTALQDHYRNNGFNHPLGPGSPNVLSALEANLVGLAPGQGYQNPAQGRENKYTESQVHANLPQVVGAFYAAEPGQYPAELINARWLMANSSWQANRLADARSFNQKFTAAGNDQVELMHLTGGHLVNGPAPGASMFPPAFFVWALAIVGVALLYKNSGELMALYRRYMQGR